MSGYFDYSQTSWFFLKIRFWFKTEILRLKPIKTCHQGLKALDYLLVMICELIETRIKINKDLKLAPKIMFIGWTRTHNYPENLTCR